MFLHNAAAISNSSLTALFPKAIPLLNIGLARARLEAFS
jgi:hypothetical protein